jgi:hypothetical protein
MEQLLPVEGFPALIIFDDGQRHILDILVRGKPLAAPQTFTSPPYRLPLFTGAGIDNFVFTMTAKWTSHEELFDKRN